MSNDFVEEEALKFEGFNDAEIAQIKVAIPKLQNLLVSIQKNQTFIDQTKTQVQNLIASIQKNQGFIDQTKAQVEELLPTLSMVTSKLKGRMT